MTIDNAILRPPTQGMRRSSLIVASFVLAWLGSASCASLGSFGDNTPIRVGRPPDLWAANEVVVALGTLQHAAIALNAITVCDPGTKIVCHPFFSDEHTRATIDVTRSALEQIDELPARWNQATLTACDQLYERITLSDHPDLKLNPYIETARAIVRGLAAR